MEIFAKRKANAEPSNFFTPRSKQPRLENESQSELENLKQLLSLSPEEIGETEADFHAHFDKIATFLFNSATLVIDSKHRFRLTEIEFYFNGGKHPDTFAHSSKDQLTCGEWYFHRTGNKLRDGSFKGLDITFGAKDVCHGGILIRSIQAVAPPKDIVEGPSLVVDQILKLTRIEKIQELVKEESLRESIFATDSILKIEAEKHSQLRSIYKGPRVGLAFKNGNMLERADYLLRDYRYLSEIGRIKKGRPLLALALYLNKQKVNTIADLFNSKAAVIQKYVDDYEKADPNPKAYFNQENDNVSFLCGLFAAIRGPKGIKALSQSPSPS